MTVTAITSYGYRLVTVGNQNCGNTNTDTILGKYEFNHSHETGKSNLKYIWIQVSTRDLIEEWVQYGVTNEEIVSDPLCDHS